MMLNVTVVYVYIAAAVSHHNFPFLFVLTMLTLRFYTTPPTT